MIRKLTLAVGFGAGYVLGAKAGKERYRQIEGKVRELMGRPTVQDFTSNISSTASAAADRAKATVNDTVEAIGDKTSSSSAPATTHSDDVVVDLSGHPVASGPIVGASASGSAPDVV